MTNMEIQCHMKVTGYICYHFILGRTCVYTDTLGNKGNLLKFISVP